MSISNLAELSFAKLAAIAVCCFVVCGSMTISFYVFIAFLIKWIIS